MRGESIQLVCIILSARDLQSQDFSLDILGIISLVVIMNVIVQVQTKFIWITENLEA